MPLKCAQIPAIPIGTQDRHYFCSMGLIDGFLLVLARLVLAFFRAMPLRWIARLGRCGGQIVFWLDNRHRRVALKNLTRCFGTSKSPQEIRSLARENFRRIGENYCCAVKTHGMSPPELREVLEVRGLRALERSADGTQTRSCVFALGHFGNFELFTSFGSLLRGYRFAATYRALRPRAINHLLQQLRASSGILFFERRSEARALRDTMQQGGVLLGLFSDQSARQSGLELPFLGYPCLTTPAPALFALRYECALFAPICYRTSLGRWSIEIGEEIATQENGARRSAEEITREINRLFEAAIERDPANWFWVHNRWKRRSSATAEVPSR
jgi:lauroyl/myristoyl acyltransferase